MEVELVRIAKDDGTNYGKDNRDDEVDELVLGLTRSTAFRKPQCHLVRESTTNEEHGNCGNDLSEVAQSSQLEWYPAIGLRLVMAASGFE